MLRRKNARAEEEKKEESAGGVQQQTVKRSPAEIRLKIEYADLLKDLPPQAKFWLLDEKDLMKFRVEIDLKDEESIWKGGKYQFECEIPFNYPYEAPKVHCHTPIYHPNIDVEGNVCLNILRKDWKPVLCVSQVIFGLIFLFLEPNPNDPLNHEAAAEFRSNLTKFKQTVTATLKGQSVLGRAYPKMI